ncbi:hypothetical protein RHMOL_Rhmol05G0172400 [Rhododendron molle]|uniref:Uncharacterized protein n=1 Tax=Rhododendron molle TaxID=49168 RepID=A0ACC0NR25_RHOML|nr:hypothetical protein RHMOL_Rhmol05G0172400 [Rhododendron molle]
MISGNAKIPSRHSRVALEPSQELHDFFPLVFVKLIRADFENCSFAHSRRPLRIGDLFIMWPADCFVAFSFRMADRYVGRKSDAMAPPF